MTWMQVFLHTLINTYRQGQGRSMRGCDMQHSHCNVFRLIYSALHTTRTHCALSQWRRRPQSQGCNPVCCYEQSNTPAAATAASGRSAHRVIETSTNASMHVD